MVGEHVLGFVEQPLRLGFYGCAHTLGAGGDPGLLGLLFGEQHLDCLATLGDLAFARGHDALGSLGRPHPRVLRRHLGRGFLKRLLIDGDCLLH